MRPIHPSPARLLCTGFALSLLSAGAHALPASVDPSKVEQRFQERLPVPASVPTGALPALPDAAAPAAEAPAQRFVLKSVAVEGATVYTPAQLAGLYAPLIGQEITIAQAQEIAQHITVKYRNAGYFLSQAIIPRQQVKRGVLHVRVVEGFVANVLIDGEVKDSRATPLVQRYAEKITRERPLTIHTLERYLLLMNDLPGASAQGTLRPSADTFGASDLLIAIRHTLVNGSLSANNRGTKFIGPQQLTAEVELNSLINRYESTQLRASTTADAKELKFFDVQHTEPLGSEGTQLMVSGSYSKTRPGSTLAYADIVGTSASGVLRLSHPFKRTRTENVTARAQLDYRSTVTDLSGLPLSNDRLSVFRTGASYDAADRFGGVNLIDGQLSKGLNILNATGSGFVRSRTDGASDFTKFNLDLSRIQPLPWSGFSLLTAATGQYSLDRLLAAEQFSLGGMGFGGGYDPSELTRDQGVAAKAELRYGNGLDWQYVNAYQLYGYYDIGKGWNRSVAGGDSLASAGLGLRVQFTPWLTGSLELALPLTRDIAATADRNPRGFFALTGRF